jgi:hypothetical protein
LISQEDCPLNERIGPAVLKHFSTQFIFPRNRPFSNHLQ